MKSLEKVGIGYWTMKSLRKVGIGLTRISHHHGQYEIHTKGGYWIDTDFPSSLSTMKSLENVGIGLTRISHHHGQYEIRTKMGIGKIEIPQTWVCQQ